MLIVDTVCSLSCSVAALDLENSASAVTEKMGMAKPPFFAGNESRSRSSGEHIWPSIIAGITT